jgi:hypothetical protein
VASFEAVSYLGFPRVNFAGTFQSDVATVNNIPPYYDNAIFEPRFQWRMRMPDINGAWNPRGTNAFRFTDVRITGACLPDGTTATTAAEDPLVTGRVTEDDLRPSGKLVDLDPEFQIVTQIWGLRLRLLDSTGRELVRGDHLPAGLEDLWVRSLHPSGRGDPAGGFHSVLTDVRWADDLTSPVLRALRDATQERTLSLKMNVDSVVDGMDDTEHWPDDLTFGRISGALGPYRSGEPRHFVAARRLRATSPSTPLNHAPCRVDDATGTVFLDLGNSVPSVGTGGPPRDLGRLDLAVLAEDGAPRVLAPLEGLGAHFYDTTGGVVLARLTEAQTAAVATARLAVVDSSPEPVVLLAENGDASLVRADGAVFRLHPGDTATTTVTATAFGRPLADAEVVFGPGQPHQDAIFPERVRTDASGRAEVVITARAPVAPRPFVDGVLVAVPFGLAAHQGAPEGQVVVRVFPDHPVPERPTWARDVQPILQQYANLYPVMRDVFDLGDYHHVLRHRTYVRRTLLADQASPNHMPASRDLSRGKRDTIVKWLDTVPVPPVLEIDTVEDLRAALQQALLVELATVPPYLAALLSIKIGRNAEIAELIRGVVVEEMQHAAQVCNLLNAVGGHPRIGRPGLVPTYPGPLPGPVLPGLVVTLRRMSLEQVENVFMAVERPDHPTVDGRPFTGAVIDPRAVSLDRRGTVLSADEDAVRTLEDWYRRAEYTPMTIGWFYNQIARAVIRLDRRGTLFSGDDALQVSWPDAPGVLYRVTDKRSALLAIYQIVEQGEGSPHDLDGDGDASDPGELGHYHRFEEIVRGRRLAKDRSGRWGFTGPEIPFDPDGVHPVVDDADTYRLRAGSAARRESELFDSSYTALLAGLQRVFNGHPDELDDAVGLMYQAQVQARKLYGIPSAEGAATVLGPAFQSPGVVL